MKPSEILRAARARIADYEQWGVASYCDSAGRWCAVGAIAETQFVLGELVSDTVKWMERAIGVHSYGPTDIRSIMRWNDLEGRTPEAHTRVLAGFDHAIKEAEEAGE